MEATLNNNSVYKKSLSEVMEVFFAKNTPDSAWALFFKMFQCWALKDCKIKAEISDEEIALFFDQLIDLVAAAYILHQASRVPLTRQEGIGRE